jgi:hypothetical protein
MILIVKHQTWNDSGSFCILDCFTEIDVAWKIKKFVPAAVTICTRRREGNGRNL